MIWVAIASAVVAMASAAIAVWQAREASKSRGAAERSAEAAERMADLAEAEAIRYEIPWRLEWRKGDTYALMNTSNADEHDVLVNVADPASIFRASDTPQTINARSEITFLAMHSMGTVDESVQVTWHRPGEAEGRAWRHPLPPRPDRGR